MRRHGDAGGQQLRPRRRDGEVAFALDREANLVKRALHGAILYLGLGHRRFEIDVPHRGRLQGVDVLLLEQVEK